MKKAEYNLYIKRRKQNTTYTFCDPSPETYTYKQI